MAALASLSLLQMNKTNYTDFHHKACHFNSKAIDVTNATDTLNKFCLEFKSNL